MGVVNWGAGADTITVRIPALNAGFCSGSVSVGPRNRYRPGPFVRYYKKLGAAPR